MTIINSKSDVPVSLPSQTRCCGVRLPLQAGAGVSASKAQFLPRGGVVCSAGYGRQQWPR